MSFFKKVDESSLEKLHQVQQLVMNEVATDNGYDYEKARDFVVASVGLYLALANDFDNPDYRRNEEIQSLAVIAHSIPTGNDSYRTQTDIIKVPKVGQSYIDHPALDLFS